MSPPKVLVVEDDLHTRRMISLVLTRDRMLRYQRLEVVTAANGLEGLRSFTEDTPALVITDLLMPEMDGFAMIEAIRKHPTGHDVPILVTSAVIRNARVLRRLERDFDVQVQLKPFSPKVLADRVRRILRGHRGEPRVAGDGSYRLPSGAGSKPGTVKPGTVKPRKVKLRAAKSAVLLEPSTLSSEASKSASSEASKSASSEHRSAKREVVRIEVTVPERGKRLSQDDAPFVAEDVVLTAPSVAEDVVLTAPSVAEDVVSTVPSVAEDAVSTGGEAEPVEGEDDGAALGDVSRDATPTQAPAALKVGAADDEALGVEAADEDGEAVLRRGGRAPVGVQGTFDAAHTVAALLLRLAEERRSGSLDLRRGRQRKVVHLFGGYPIFVQSNLRAETLGRLLVKRGGLTDAQHEEVLALAKGEGLKYGEALVRAGLMTEEAVLGELVGQTRHKVQSALRWAEGEWTFTDDSEIGAKVPRCTIDPVETVLSGLGNADVHRVLAKLFEGGVDRRFVLEVDVEQYGSVISEIFGADKLVMLVAGPSLGELVAADDPTGAVAADALVQAGLARYEALSGGRVSRELAVVAAERVRSATGVAPALEHLVDRRKNPEAAAMGRDLQLSGAWASGGEIDARTREDDRIAKALVESAYLGLHAKTHYEVLGVIPETGISGIEVAYAIKRKQFDLSRFRERDLNEAYAHLEEIGEALDVAYAVLSDVDRRQHYDETLTERRVPRPNAGMQAEALFEEGQSCFEDGAYDEAIARFEAAIALDDQPEFRVQEALAYFLAEGEAPEAGVEAMVRVQAALSLDPEQPRGHLVAALISKTLGAVDEAVEHLREALHLAPRSREAFDALERLLLENERIEDLEAEYRRTIFRVGSQDRAWSAALWKRLVLLYRDRIKDEDRARKACDAAFRLNPTDAELRAVLRQLVDAAVGMSDRWPQAVLGYRSLLRNDPNDLTSLKDLFTLHRAEGREDAARVVARIASWRGEKDLFLREAVGDDETSSSLRLSGRAFDADDWKLIQDPDDDLILSELFELLAPLVDELDPLTPDDLDVGEGMDAGPSLSDDFSVILRHVCRILGQEALPRVVVRGELGGDIQVVGTTPPLLLVGTEALELSNRRELAFRLGRALTLLEPARRLVAWRSPTLLRDYLLAAVRLADAAAALPLASPRSERVRQAIAADDELSETCRLRVQALHDRGDDLDLERWQGGVQRTADRVGLLLSADIRVALRVGVEVDSPAEIALVDFALSERYVTLRDRLGLAI